MSEVAITLTGFVATEPRLVVSANGTAYTTFRTASTRRYFDRATGEWRDGQTLWFSVKTWRDTARNVASSLRKGDPVVVQGVLGVDEWAGADGPRTSLVVEARSLGPDLSRGETRFVPVVHRASVPGEEPDAAGPADAATAAPADDAPADDAPADDAPADDAPADDAPTGAPDEAPRAREDAEQDDPWAVALAEETARGAQAVTA